MEKIKFGSTQYDLVPVGTHYIGEQLQITFVWPDGGSYEEVEASLTGCDRIEVLSESGETTQKKETNS
ncbi:MAG: hypothetical protein ACRDBO_05200 [Lachnospiraceae bacterium]